MRVRTRADPSWDGWPVVRGGVGPRRLRDQPSEALPELHPDVAELLGLAATGPLAFVALMSPPVATALTRGRTSIVACALVGAVVVVVANFTVDMLYAAIDPRIRY